MGFPSGLRPAYLRPLTATVCCTIACRLVVAFGAGCGTRDTISAIWFQHTTAPAAHDAALKNDGTSYETHHYMHQLHDRQADARGAGMMLKSRGEQGGALEQMWRCIRIRCGLRCGIVNATRFTPRVCCELQRAYSWTSQEQHFAGEPPLLCPGWPHARRHSAEVHNGTLYSSCSLYLPRRFSMSF